MVGFIGTMQDPIVVRSFGDEQYAGCTGVPADTHTVWWLTVGGLVTLFIQDSWRLLTRPTPDVS